MATKPETEKSPWDKLRAPFPENQISKLPKPQAKREVMDQLPKAICRECGQYHATSRVMHLDYVGHAAVTDRLLDVDPGWTWEPLATDQDGFPKMDSMGGLWIKLTICGVTRLGYGDAPGKIGGDGMKERIGDAIRNAAMRFGVALDLWHKGELHPERGDDPEGDDSGAGAPPQDQPASAPGASNANGWDAESLSKFESILDRAYTAFKAAGQTIEAYNEFATKWKEARKANSPEETLAKLDGVVKKLEEAAAKKKKGADLGGMA